MIKNKNKNKNKSQEIDWEKESRFLPNDPKAIDWDRMSRFLPDNDEDYQLDLQSRLFQDDDPPQVRPQRYAQLGQNGTAGDAGGWTPTLMEMQRGASAAAQNATQGAPGEQVEDVDYGYLKSVRNNNPGSVKIISKNEPWNGQIGTDGDFAVFEKPYYGLRAWAVNAITKYNRGLNTISSLISVLSPRSNNNDTEKIAKYVANRAGVGVKDLLDFTDPALLAKTLRGVSEYETSPAASRKLYSDEAIDMAVRAAIEYHTPYAHRGFHQR